MKITYWFIGKSQQDEGEPDTFDGTVWEPPTAEEQQNPEADCYLVARGIREERYARLIASAPELLAVIEEYLSARDGVRLTSTAGYRESNAALDRQERALEAMKTAVRKAKGEKT